MVAKNEKWKVMMMDGRCKKVPISGELRNSTALVVSLSFIIGIVTIQFDLWNCIFVQTLNIISNC